MLSGTIWCCIARDIVSMFSVPVHPLIWFGTILVSNRFVNFDIYLFLGWSVVLSVFSNVDVCLSYVPDCFVCAGLFCICLTVSYVPGCYCFLFRRLLIAIYVIYLFFFSLELCGVCSNTGSCLLVA